MTVTPSVRRWRSAAFVLAASLALAGCATGPNAHPQDPLEPFNRGVYRFNDALDKAVLKPVATAYRDTLPSPVRTGVGNFFGNLRDVWSAVNAALQARPREAVDNLMRFGVNTFFGVGGLIDFASDLGIERTSLDFGQTLARWGVPTGPYLVLPLRGPSSVRDAAATVVDIGADPVRHAVEDQATRTTLMVVRTVDDRAKLLGAGAVLDSAALDPYSFLRDAYLQRRQNPVEEPVQEERYDLE